MRMEFALLDGIQRGLRGPLMDAVMVAVTRLGDGGVLFFLLAAGLTVYRPTRTTGWCLLCALGVEVLVCNGVIKPFFGRVRPFVGVEGVELLIPAPVDGSFPSGHTCMAFAVAGVLRLRRHPLGAPMMVLAVGMGFSRLYLYVHFPSDVVFGALLGWAIARGAVWGWERWAAWRARGSVV